MKQNRILDILTGNLKKEGRKFDKQQLSQPSSKGYGSVLGGEPETR